MSARDKILERLWWAVPSTDNADAKVKAAQMLDDFAHELAESQRKMPLPDSRDRHWVRFGVNLAADTIDPEVKK